jgi:UV radiation resistance-associated gene protein
LNSNDHKNRRLRHVHGISLRNLNLSSASVHRAKSTTDDDAPYNLDTPTKRALRNEGRGLAHSASFTNLPDTQSARPSPVQKVSTTYTQDGKLFGARPGGRLRRRSTLHWSSASPRARQEKLRDLTSHRLLDTFFSLHIGKTPDKDPIYVSEVMEKCMNPSFAFFDLDMCEPVVARADACRLRIWTRISGTASYSMLVDLDVNLRSLQFIGTTLEHFHHPLPENCVLLHLSDGIYTSFTDMPGRGFAPEALRGAKPGPVEGGSSFDALMQLANLDECIQDAVRVRRQLEDDVNDLITKQSTRRECERSLQSRRDQLSSLQTAVAHVQTQNDVLKRKIQEMRKAMQGRQQDIAPDPDAQSRSERRKAEQTKRIQTTQTSAQELDTSSSGQIRRIGEALLTIFPIEAIHNKPLHFSIRHIYLPNSVYDDTNRDEIAAALGFTTQLVYQLSMYLLCVLPYPLEPNASSSWIEDPISVGLTQRRFPLFPISVAYRFDYGVYLLNKDIEFLMSKAGLRVLDIRHTLPNLKYLLFVLTAGSGEMPARKAGGVRGLIGGRITPSVSRRTSEDSVSSQLEFLRHARGNGNAAAKEKSHDIFSSSPPTTKLAYRPSNLRETG